MSKLLSDNRFDLRIRDCKFGRGVFAGKDFAPKALIEVCPVLLFDKHEEHMAWLTSATNLGRYYFGWGDTHSALAFGYGSLYNHSKRPNADYSCDIKSNEIVIFALKKIKKGDQIFVSYGYDPTKKHNV